ncbi:MULTISPECIES: hypothetical protein, partial [unclassified Paenibacillus]
VQLDAYLENLAGETNSQYSKGGLSSIMSHGTSCFVHPGIAWGLMFELILAIHFEQYCHISVFSHHQY